MSPRVIVAAAVLAIAGVAGWMAESAAPQVSTPQARTLSAQAPAPVPARPGKPAPPDTSVELRRAVADAVTRFEARDAVGVLAHVSEEYRTTPLSKRVLRDQLTALFGLYDAVQASVRVDEVRMVGGHAWIWSTGEVTGRLALVGRWMPLFSWERELEVARREDGRWRLYGYQQ